MSSIFESELIPDYVVNFMRGETPETLAQKRRRRGPQTPDYGETSRGHNSHAVDLLDTVTASDADSRAPSRQNDMEKMLGDGGCRPGFMRSLMSGWRGGVALNLLLAFLILVVSIICLVLSSMNAGSLAGGSTIMNDKTPRVKGLNSGLHIIFNVFGIVLIAGANYVFQILTSPTREEVDNAHEKLQWMDIGIPSFRNLTAIRFGRALLAATILSLAIGSQVM